MSNSGNFHHFPATLQSSPPRPPEPGADPLANLSAVRARMDSLHRFLSHSVNSNTLIGNHQMEMVSAEISAAIHQIILNGAALLSSTQNPPRQTTNPSPITDTASDLKFPVDLGDVETKPPIDSTKIPVNSIGAVEMKVEDEEMKDEVSIDDYEIVELDAVELLAEHIHFCDICGKGFKRDANLRMHMRAHGNQFKTVEALAKPAGKVLIELTRRKTRFSCPFVGCNRNKSHKKFRPLKSTICVKNHFKRSHCPKLYACNRCNKKSFSVVADLKSHLKHCGESKWKCSCGTTFSRKDKLFGHVALFEGHMPALVAVEELEEEKAVAVAVAVAVMMEEDETGVSSGDNGFFEGLLDGFGMIEGCCLEDVLGSPHGLGATMDELYNF